MFCYTGHTYSSIEHNGLDVESCEMCVVNCLGWEKADGRCGLIYLMVMCTGNTLQSDSYTSGKTEETLFVYEYKQNS